MLFLKKTKMLYELKKRNLAKSLYLAINFLIDADNMVFHSGDTIKELIFFKSLFEEITDRDISEQALLKIVTKTLEDKHLNYFFVNELPADLEKINFIAYLEYKRYLKEKGSKGK
jgi:hypothetical protein